MTTKIRLFLGEQDGKVIDAVENSGDYIVDGDSPDWTVDSPPLHIWVVTALGERELAKLPRGSEEPAGLRESLTTCAYRFTDDLIDTDNDVLDLCYERDVSADREVSPAD